MNWYIEVLKKYAEFTGRARRTEYWMFVLFNMVFAVLALVLDNLLGLTVGGLPYGILYFLYVLAVFIPGLAVLVRRLHDTNQSGYMVFVSLIPIIGSIWLLVLLFKESDPNDNQYGKNPKLNEAGLIKSDPNQGDNILLVVLIWMVLTRIFWITLPIFFDSYFQESWFTPLSMLLNFVWSFIPLALAFTAKDKSKQVILFVLGGIYLALAVGDMVYNFIQSKGPFF